MHAVMRTIATRYALAVSRVAACSPMRSWSRDIPYMNANSGDQDQDHPDERDEGVGAVEERRLSDFVVQGRRSSGQVAGGVCGRQRQDRRGELVGTTRPLPAALD